MGFHSPYREHKFVRTSDSTGSHTELQPSKHSIIPKALKEGVKVQLLSRELDGVELEKEEEHEEQEVKTTETEGFVRTSGQSALMVSECSSPIHEVRFQIHKKQYIVFI